MKYKPQHIHDPIYQMDYYASYGTPIKVFTESYKRIVGENPQIGTGTSGYTAFLRIKGQRITWIWTKRKCVPFLVHEIVHAVAEHFDFIGMKLTNESDEAYAYYTQWLLEEILKS